MYKTRFLFALLSLAIGAQITFAQTNITVDVKNTGSSIQSTMYGIFFEDINYGADGGLYGELIKNRSFEFPQSLLGWSSFGNVEVRTDNAPFPNNPHYIRLADAGHGDKRTGLDNEGFFGIGVNKEAEYRFSVWARVPQGDKSEISAELIDAESNVIGSGKITINSKAWKKYEVIIKSSKTEAKARLRIFLKSQNTVDLEHVSLFPVDTWQGRENGMRKDLAQALYDLHPGVFRFPGGCIVEGTDISDRYQWKHTVGQVENRKLNLNRWQYTFEHRFFPDYYQSYGLGFYEYFLLSEDIGAEPLPVLNVGMACQYQNHNKEEAHVKVCDLDPYIQDALDLIEFANGEVNTKWGKLRAEMGHPAPFNLKLLAIGNEQWGKMYPERLEPFVKVLREKHPEIKIIGSSGPASDGEDFDYGWKEMKRLKVDLVDEHYYRSPEWFLNNAARYDKYDRNDPKVFAGEYACHAKNRKNNFESALSEAALMTGFERNADVVHMCTYAPLFAHYEGWQWKPDMIWFDNLQSVKTPNYYVQQLYGMHVGTNVLKTDKEGVALTGQDGLYASSVIDKAKNEIYLKIANTSNKVQKVVYTLKGLKKGKHNGTHILLEADDMDEVNSLENPNAIVPQTSNINFENDKLEVELAPKSFNLFTIKL